MVETDQEGEKWKTVLHRRKRKSCKEEEVTVDRWKKEDWTRANRKCQMMNSNALCEASKIWDRKRYSVCLCGEIFESGDWRLHMKCLGCNMLEWKDFKHWLTEMKQLKQLPLTDWQYWNTN